MFKPKIKKLLYLFLLCTTIGTAYGFTNPQNPPEPTNTTFSPDGLPPPGLVPIDDHLPLLIIVALVLGIVFLKRKKASVI